jgi:ATP-dependent DNA helicase RecG
MTHDDLLELLAQVQRQRAETAYVEAKASRQALPKRLYETLSAFANTEGGGVLLLGIDETEGFAARGVGDPAKIQADLASLCDQMEPPLRPLIQCFEVDDTPVIVAEIAELPVHQKPCYYKGAGLPNGAFVRVGDGDRTLTPYEVQAFLDARHQPRHDIAPVPGTSWADLDPELYRPLLARLRQREGGPYRSLDDEQVLRMLKVLVPDESGGWAVSLFGWLCFAPFPQSQFPNLCATFAHHPTAKAGELGPSGERLLDNARIEGPLGQIVLATMHVLRRNMQRRAIVQGLFRHDVWEYPETALREAIVNALAHRDLSVAAQGAQVQIHMYPDRLEILSPGGLFGPIQVDQLGDPGVQSSRNPYLMRILEDLPAPGDQGALGENRGSGLTAMMSQLRQAGMSPPQFDVSLTRFRLVMPNHTLYTTETLQWLAEMDQRMPLTERDRQSLAFLRHVQRMSNGDYCRLTGVDSRIATRDLGSLVDRGLVVRLGTGRWSNYALSPTIAHRPAVALEPSPTSIGRRLRQQKPQGLESIQRLLAGSQGLSARQLAEHMQLPLSTVRLWLRQLRDAGIITAGSSARNAPNTRYYLQTERRPDTQGS